MNVAALLGGDREYWDRRYRGDRGSGLGSRGDLARYKADLINELVAAEGVGTVLDVGCGDGVVASMLDVPSYLGCDISMEAVNECRARVGDPRKAFVRLRQGTSSTALSFDAALSLDVLFHATGEDAFKNHLRTLFGSADRFVIIYSSDTDSNGLFQAPHCRNRQFTRVVEETYPDWALIDEPPNPHSDHTDSRFFVYERRGF